MNRTLYNAAMEKVTMSEQCESRIFEAAVNMSPTVKKRKGKIRFIPVLAAVLIIGTTSAAAEGAFNWIKNMFSNNDFEITDEIVGMTGEMNNFICESQGGDIEISPVGMIAEESTIYCLLHVDKMPDDIDFKNLKLQDININDESPAHHRRMTEDCELSELQGGSFGYGMRYKDDNLLAIEIFPSYKAFSDGDKITIKFVKLPDAVMEDNEIYRTGDSISWCDGPFEYSADVSFDIGMGEVNYLEKTYDEGTVIQVDTKELFIENLRVSPLRIMISGQVAYSEYWLDENIQVTFNDGSMVTVSGSGSSFYSNDKSTVTVSGFGSESLNDESTVTISGFGSGSLNDDNRHIWESEWSFENPIDPENISTIYINDVCLYDSSEQ